MVMASARRGPTKVVGRYALYGEIAAGGMATVHIGRLLGPVGFARTVAVKRLHPQYAKDPEFVSMFLDEARVAARVQHPNVVATIDVVATDGELFLIMDYVRGESLSRLVRAASKIGEHVPPRICAAIMCGFLHGLHAAHEAKNERGEPLGLVHRDVSPQNVLVGSDGVARALDFGIAKAAGRAQVTRDGQIKGKLAYMPPEQLRGQELTRATDVYASAVVLWETLTGERLFKGDTEPETLARIIKGDVPLPSSIVPDLLESYDDVVLKGLAKDPALRWATARDMARALERCDGIASPSEVGEWVERIAGEAIEAREERVAEMESETARLELSPSGTIKIDEPSDSDISAPIHPQGMPSPLTGAALAAVGPSSDRGPVSSDRGKPVSARAAPSDATDPSVPQLATGILDKPVHRRPLVWVIAGGVALLLFLGVVAVVASANKESKDAKEPGAGGSASASASVTSAAPTATATASAPASAAVIELPADPSPAPSARPFATSKPKPGTPPPPPPPPVKKNCDPPYTVDAKGHRHYKVECM